MSRDGGLRTEFRELEAATPGGLASADAVRAFALLRRGGLRFYRLSEGRGADFVTLGVVVGPDGWTEERFSAARAQYEELLGPWRVRARRLRARMEALELAAGGPYEPLPFWWVTEETRGESADAERAARRANEERTRAREKAIMHRTADLLLRRASAVGADFLHHLELLHGFAAVPRDLGFNVWPEA